MEKKDWIFDRSFRIGEIRKKNFLKKLRKKKENLFCMIKKTYGVAA
jgi:hypothetical protein